MNSKIDRGILAGLCMVLSACHTLPEQAAQPGSVPPHAELHTIYINRFGDVAPLGKQQPSVRATDAVDTCPPGPADNTGSGPAGEQAPQGGEDCSGNPDYLSKGVCEAAYVARVIANFKRLDRARTCKNGKPLTLTIFVHGGLNAFVGATGRSDKYSADMLAEGTYPVFIAWNSGGPTNYLDHLYRIRKGESRPALGVISAPLVFAEDMTRSLLRIPAAAYRAVSGPLSVMKRIDSEEEQAYQVRIARLAQSFQVTNNPPHVGVGDSYWTVLNPVKLLTAPFIDGLGTGAWQSMLRRTELVLSKSEAFEGRGPQDKNFHADTAATTFLKEWAEDKTLRAVDVHLIGHSMGAIVANNIIARHPKLNVTELVYMGGAVRIKDVESVVVPWLRHPEHSRANFYNLSIDPYLELGENYFHDFVPRGTLLDWIDNIFGEVNSFKDRTVGSWWNVVRAAEDVFPHEVLPPDASRKPLRKRVHLTRFPIGGEEMGPQKHGEFDEYCFWRPSFWRAGPGLKRHPGCVLSGAPSDD